MVDLTDSLEEIEALPVGEIISVRTAAEILEYLITKYRYHFSLVQSKIVETDHAVYIYASDYDKLLMDHYRDWLKSDI